MVEFSIIQVDLQEQEGGGILYYPGGAPGARRWRNSLSSRRSSRSKKVVEFSIFQEEFQEQGGGGILYKPGGAPGAKGR